MYTEISSTDPYLRPYQQEAKDSIFREWDTTNNVMLQMPTGTGKTVLFSSIIKDIHNWMIRTQEYQKILIIVHRTELIEQTKDKLGKQYHVASGVIAGNYVRDLKPQVQIASIQTLTHPANEYLANKLKVGFIIIDEAHHALASSYQKLWDLYPNAKKLGVTATPWRMNHAGFMDLFDKLIQSWTIRKFIDEKFLAKFKYYSIRPTSEEQQAIDGIREFDIEGDYKISAMERAMDIGHIRANLLESYKKYAKGKRGIIYAITKQHGKRICKDYQDAGINIDYIDSETKPQDRKNIVEKFRKGDIEILVNVDIFSEGFDCPALDFVQLARPTRSLVKYLQQVGRALRPNGRKQAIILDNVGMFKRFGLPDANRKWAYHFKGIDVEERGYDEETEVEYTYMKRRLNDFIEGSEDMVLLNGKTLEDKVTESDNRAPEQIMEEKLDYLGIKHGVITCDQGLFFDFLEKEDSYVYRQISIKYSLRYIPLLTIAKDSILGRLCKEFGPCFAPELSVDPSGTFYYDGGISYKLGNLKLLITSTNELCYQYDDTHLKPFIEAPREEEYDISRYNKDLQELLSNSSPTDSSVQQLYNLFDKSGIFVGKDKLFILHGNLYLAHNDSELLIIRKLSLTNNKLHKILVASANKNSYLYERYNKLGSDAIKYINHIGGRFGTIMVKTEDDAIYITNFEGDEMNCFYDFEVIHRYLYAKSINSKSAISDDKVSVFSNDEMNLLFGKKTDTNSQLPTKQPNEVKGYDYNHKFQIKQKNGSISYGYYNPSDNSFLLVRYCQFLDFQFKGSQYQSTKEDLLKHCYLVSPGVYSLNTDYKFSSPSTAASIIKGCSTNGYITWKTADGKSLKEVFNL